MAATMRGSASRTGTSTAVTSFTLTLSASTVAGDIALVSVIAVAGVSSVTGLGAAWGLERQGNSGTDNTELWIGRGCTASNTVITVNLVSSDRADAMAVLVGPGTNGLVQKSSVTVADGSTTGLGLAGVFDAPPQDITVIGQIVVDFFWINGGWGGSRVLSDTPSGTFSTLTSASVSAWYSEGEFSSYWVSNSIWTSVQQRVDTGTGTNQNGALYSVLIGDSPVVAGVRDNFNRANSTTSLGNTSLGNLPYTILGGSTFGISGNQAYQPSGSGIATQDLGWADGTISVALVIGGNSRQGLAFRIQDVNNLWFAEAGALVKYTAGTRSVVTSYTTFVGDALQVILSGNSIVVNRITGGGSGAVTQVASTTDSYLATQTKHGFGNLLNSINDRWDDFTIITPATPSGTVIADNFNRTNTLSLGSTSTGNAWWTTESGVWGTDGSVAKITTLDSTIISDFARVDAGSSEGLVEVDIPVVDASGFTGVMIRTIRKGDGVLSGYVFAYSSGGFSGLYRITSGIIQVGSSVTLAAGDRIGLRAQGTTITCYRNGSLVLTATSETNNQTATGIGLIGYTTSQFDNLQFTPPPKSMIFNDRRIRRNSLLRR
jgi:hypothetical protein